MEFMDLLPECWERVDDGKRNPIFLENGVNKFRITGLANRKWDQSFVSSIDGNRYKLRNPNAIATLDEQEGFIKISIPAKEGTNVPGNTYYIDMLGRANQQPTQSGADYCNYCKGSIKLEQLSDKYFTDPLFYMSVLKNEENQFNSYYFDMNAFSGNFIDAAAGIDNSSIDTNKLKLRATIAQANLDIARQKRNIAQYGIQPQFVEEIERIVKERDAIQEILDNYSSRKIAQETKSELLNSFAQEYGAVNSGLGIEVTKQSSETLAPATRTFK